MSPSRLIVAWISDYPLEWMANLPTPLGNLPKRVPSTWMPVLLAELEKREGLQIHVLILRKGLAHSQSFTRNGSVFHVLKVPSRLRAPSLFWTDTVIIRRALRAINPDLVHAWGTERGEALVASRLGYPYVVTVQGLMAWYKDRASVDIHERFASYLEPLSLRRARVSTVESRFAVEYLRRNYPKLVVHQAEHAPNKVFHQIERRPKLTPPRLLTVGTLSHRKGTDLLLLGLAQLSAEFSFELVIVGLPPWDMVRALKAKLSPRFWSRISLRSALSPAQVAEELAAATISVLPTRADTSPNAVKEAVVAGVPVVASAIGGIPDYVFSDRNGFLFRAGDVAEFVRAMRAALQHPLFRVGRVESSCWNAARAYLSPERMAERFVAAYGLVLEQRWPCVGG